MSKKRKGGKFAIADPQRQIENLAPPISKYNLGDKGSNFYDIKHLTPVFAFDYVSFNQSCFCFNCTSLGKKDYIGLLTGLKKISSITYDVLSKTSTYRFHKVEFSDTTLSETDFKKILCNNNVGALKDIELPTLYQFDPQYLQSARVLGFLFKGIFYLIWFDKDHRAYKRK